MTHAVPQAPVTAAEHDTHVWPLAEENWSTAHGRSPVTEADYDEVAEWAQILRGQYDNGSFEITWR